MHPLAYLNVAVFLDKFTECLKYMKLNVAGYYEEEFPKANYCVVVVEKKRVFAKPNALMVFLELDNTDDRFFSLIKIPFLIHEMKDMDFFCKVILSAASCFGYLPETEVSRMIETLRRDRKYTNDYFGALWEEVNEGTSTFILVPRLDVFVKSRMQPT